MHSPKIINAINRAHSEHFKRQLLRNAEPGKAPPREAIAEEVRTVTLGLALQKTIEDLNGRPVRTAGKETADSFSPHLIRAFHQDYNQLESNRLNRDAFLKRWGEYPQILKAFVSNLGMIRAHWQRLDTNPPKN